MKLIKITNEHYVVVDDSEIEENDWCCNIQRPYIKQCQDFDVIYYNKRNDLFKKITHSTLPLEQMKQPNKEICIGNFMKGQSKIQPLSLQEVKELIGEVDVNKRKNEYIVQVNERIENRNRAQDERIWILGASDLGFTAGYKKALEDNKDKKYTEEDMKYMFECGRNYQNSAEVTFKMSIEYLQQPKTEWEIEEIDGKFKLK